MGQAPDRVEGYNDPHPRCPGMVRTVLVVLLLAGCLSPSPVPQGNDAPVQVDVVLSATQVGPGQVLHGNATVSNAGDVPVRHYGYCDPPVGLRFVGPDGGDVAVGPPVARCEALGVETLAPGESKTVAFTFDGRVWDGDRQRSAPPGSYEVLATFRHWPADAPDALDVPQDDVVEVVARATWTYAASAGDVAVEVVALPRTGGAPGTPVEVTATATNTGTVPVAYDGNPCAGLRLRFLAPDGAEVQVDEPRFCTQDIRSTPLAPGEVLRANATFDGTSWVGETTRAVSPGGYRVEATLGWWTGGDIQRRAEAKATTGFQWGASGGIVAGGPEIELVADRTTFTKGETVTVNATVTNQGESAVYVDAICAGPFRVEVLDAAGDVVPHREPFGTCMAISLEPFGPGERRFLDATWDGRAYDDEGPTYVEPGRYTFVVRFVWWDTDQPEGQPHATEARVDVEWRD